MINISFKDDGNLGYTITSDSYILGHRYDNCANQIQVQKPECEADSVCVMIVTHKDQIIKRVEIHDEPVDVCNNLSRFYEVEIGFTFKRADGYVKNTSKKTFTFIEAIKPDDFVLEENKNNVDLDLLNSKAFVDCDVNEDNIVEFKNIQGQVIKELELKNSSENTPVDLTGYATKDYVNEIVGDYTTKDYVNEIVGDYATKDYVNEIVGDYTTKDYVDEFINVVVGDYATKNYVDEIVVTTQNYVNEIVGDIDTALSNILGV